MRKVSWFKIDKDDNITNELITGYFHQFGNVERDNGNYNSITVAIVEDETGQVDEIEPYRMRFSEPYIPVID